MGGSETAVNEAHELAWLDHFNCPPGLICLAVYLCSDRMPMCVDGCCELVPPTPSVIEYSNSGCLPATQQATGAGEEPWSPDEQIEFVVEGNTVRLTHRNATYNCCVDDIVVSLRPDGSRLRVGEEEVLTIPCLCLCSYDVESSIGGLSSGSHVIDYCWRDYGGGEVCQTEVLEIP